MNEQALKQIAADPEVPAMPAELKAPGIKPAILSSGTPQMLPARLAR